MQRIKGAPALTNEEMFARVFKTSHSPEEFLKFIDDFEGHSCETMSSPFFWGSCQYDSMAATFKILQAMHVTPAQGAKLMGATLEYHKNSLGEASKKAKAVVGEHDSQEDGPTDKEVKEMLSHHKNSLKFKRGKRWELRLNIARNPSLVLKDGDTFLLWARESAWDLWQAIPPIVETYFDISLTRLFPDVESVAPMSDDDESFINHRLGLLAYLLFYEGIVKKEESFKGFDT